jgi:hypothetical protein
MSDTLGIYSAVLEPYIHLGSMHDRLSYRLVLAVMEVEIWVQM